jgi:hypothetical protein
MKSRFDPSPALPTNTGRDSPDTSGLSCICAMAGPGRKAIAMATNPRRNRSMRTGESFLNAGRASVRKILTAFTNLERIEVTTATWLRGANTDSSLDYQAR